MTEEESDAAINKAIELAGLEECWSPGSVRSRAGTSTTSGKVATVLLAFATYIAKHEPELAMDPIEREAREACALFAKGRGWNDAAERYLDGRQGAGDSLALAAVIFALRRRDGKE